MSDQSTATERERIYKYYILEEVAKVLMPWVYDDSAKLSEAAKKVLRINARGKAKEVMKAISPFITPFDHELAETNMKMIEDDMAKDNDLFGNPPPPGGGKALKKGKKK